MWAAFWTIQNGDDFTDHYVVQETREEAEEHIPAETYCWGVAPVQSASEPHWEETWTPSESATSSG